MGLPAGERRHRDSPSCLREMTEDDELSEVGPCGSSVLSCRMGRSAEVLRRQARALVGWPRSVRRCHRLISRCRGSSGADRRRACPGSSRCPRRWRTGSLRRAAKPRKCDLRMHEHDAVGDVRVHARRERQGVGREWPRLERRAERVEEPTIRPTDAVDRDRGRELKVSRIDAAFGQPGGGPHVQVVTSRGTPVDAMTMLRSRPDEGMLPSMTRRAFTLD